MASGRPWDDGAHMTVKGLKITYGDLAIHSIQVEYETKEGHSFWADRHGGGGAIHSTEIKLDKEGEYLTSVTGYQRKIRSQNLVTSITFISNERTFGPFGWEKGSDFSIIAPEGSKIVGLKGTSMYFINSIEAHFEPTEPPLSEESVVTVGPFGGTGGRPWDDDHHDEIKQIQVTIYESKIESIQVQYDDGGNLKWAARHGGNSGGLPQLVKLEDPLEFLNLVSGYHAACDSEVIIHSLTFQSNKRTYGPYGTEKGTYFSLSSPRMKITGLKGSSGNDSLCSIGAHTVPVQEKSAYIDPIGGSGGEDWDHDDHYRIRKIKLACPSQIKSIAVEYDDMGQSVTLPKAGVDDGEDTKEVTLHSPDEFLISVSGYCSKGTCGTVSSLTFHTNQRILGPFGKIEGEYFSFPSISGRVSGFAGKSTSGALKSIGGWVFPLFPASSKPFLVKIPYGGKPHGGGGGKSWDDGGEYTAVRKIVISGASRIRSITIEYDKNGRLVQRTHGDTIGGQKHEAKFDYPNEFIVSISGRYASSDQPAVITSLSIHTNKRSLGPFGYGKGEDFTLSSERGKIIGFWGRAANSLDAIGIYSKPIHKPSYYESNGPYGGRKGGPWDHGVNTGIRKIEVYVGQSFINAFRVEYDVHGCSVWSQKRGGTGPEGEGTKNLVELDYPGEYLILVMGHYDRGSGGYIRSLSFQTNIENYGPFGHPCGYDFKFPCADGKIVGFHGRSGWYIDAIGAYVVPLPRIPYPSKMLQLVKGQGGEEWDDGAHDTVRQITIATSCNGVECIRFDYDRNGWPVPGKEHGKRGSKANKQDIKLNYPNEFLTYIAGSYAPCSNSSVIVKSLTFHSNKRALGPYGVETGTHFSSEGNAGMIAGFHGKQSTYGIQAFGVYLKPVPDGYTDHNQIPQKDVVWWE